MEGHIGLTLGVDEAGRGAQIGPLVLAAVALTPPQALQLLDLGLHDSKRLTTTARAWPLSDAARTPSSSRRALGRVLCEVQWPACPKCLTTGPQDRASLLTLLEGGTTRPTVYYQSPRSAEHPT